MKKDFLKSIMALFAGALISFSLVACGDESTDNSGNNGNNNTEQPENENPVADGDVMTPEQQKQKLEAVAKQFLSYVKASDFTDVRDLAKDLKTKYDGVEPSEDLGQWWNKTLDNITTYIGGGEFYSEYQRLYSAAQVKGHFTISNGQWIRTEANDLQISLKDSQGRDCVATLTTSGSTKKLFVGEDTDREYNNYNYFDYIYNNYVNVPQNINLVATVGGQQWVNVTLTTDLSQVSEMVDLTKDRASVTMNATVKSFNINLTRAVYQAQGQAAVALTLKKDNTQLLSVNVEGSTKVSGSSESPKLAGGNISNMNVDVLGQVQAKGNVDITAIMNETDGEISDEATARQVAEKISSHLKNIGIYYDNGETRRAWLGAAATQHNKSYNPYWSVGAVICFQDGTKYKFDDYFEETNWQSVINIANQIADDFNNLINSLNVR